MQRGKWGLLVALGSQLTACPRQAPPPPPPIVTTPVPAAPPPTEVAEPPARAEAAAPEDPRTPIGDWGVEVFVPEGASSEHEAAANRHSIRLSENVSVALAKVPEPPRTELTHGTHERNVQVFERGTTPDGVVYVILSFQVRVGVPSSRPGRHLHTFKTISRVFAELPLDPRNRVECTGYLEDGVESLTDPDIQMLRRICLSIRRRK